MAIYLVYIILNELWINSKQLAFFSLSLHFSVLILSYRILTLNWRHTSVISEFWNLYILWHFLYRENRLFCLKSDAFSNGCVVFHVSFLLFAFLFHPWYTMVILKVEYEAIYVADFCEMWKTWTSHAIKTTFLKTVASQYFILCRYL